MVVTDSGEDFDAARALTEVGLEVARTLIRRGVPIFAAPPAMKNGKWDPRGGTGGCGYWLPKEWEKTIPAPGWLDPSAGRNWAEKAWRPGWALGAVMGHQADGLDVDPRNGGTDSIAEMRAAGVVPRTTGLQRTPSGGWHALIAPLGVGSHDAIRPGVDIKGGKPNGEGRGFLFIAPTVKLSKVTGELGVYVWESLPDLDEMDGDTSGEALAALIVEPRARHTAAGGSKLTDEEEGHTGPIPDGKRHRALVSYAGLLRRRRLTRDEAEVLYRRRWQDCAQPPNARYAVTWDEALDKLDDVFDRYAPGPAQEDVEDLVSGKSATAGATRSEDGAPGTPERPGHECSNTAVQADWLREVLGTGPLSGMFARGPDIVHTPQEGEDGYIPLSERARDHDGPAQVQVVRKSTLASRIQYRYTCYKKVWDPNKKAWTYTPAMFPIEAARVATDVPDELPHLRTLRGVVHTPVFRPDGTILAAPGYDPATGLLHLPEPGLSVPPVSDRPTAVDLKSAVALVEEMVGEFRFLSEHDKANYYGLLLTPLLRTLAPPPYKLGAIGAPQPGSGKSLLASILRIIHGGVFRSEVPEDDAEMRKQITSILSVTTGAVVQFDNVSGVLRSSTLSGLLTSNRWDDRPLGVTDMVSRDNDRLWVITGNNLALGGDLVRRTLWVTIDPGVPDPHLRTGFTIGDLETWAKTRRGDLLHALLTMIRAWVNEGRPVVDRQSDSYAGWVGAVAGILKVANVEGTFDAAESARQSVGVDDDDWAVFLKAARAVFADGTWSVKDLLAQVDAGGFGHLPIPLDALPAELAERVARSQSGAGIVARSLGMWLRNRDGRWAGALTVRAAGSDLHNKTNLWRIHSAEDKPQPDSAGTAGTAGTSSEPGAGDSKINFVGAHREGGSEAPKQSPQSPQSPQLVLVASHAPQPPPPGDKSVHDHDGRSPLSLARRPCEACRVEATS